MAQTYRNLWSQVVSWENLLRAYRKCRRRKRYRAPAAEFDFAWEEHLVRLQRDLIDGTYEHGPYHHFHISDPKPRQISAAPFRDRIVHHALVSVLEPIFERGFIQDSYACRVGKGTHRALKRAQYFQRRYPWCLQTDIVKFFPSVDHEILLTTIRRRIADHHVLLLVEAILATGHESAEAEVAPQWFDGDDLLSALRPRGLPIGNLTSQFFANVLLDPVDHAIQESLGVRGYIRYADDLLLFGETKQQLWRCVESLGQLLSSYRLRLHPRKTHVLPTSGELTYLGFRVSPHSLRVSQQGIRRFIRRSRQQRQQFARGELSLRKVPSSLMAWKSHLQRSNSRSISRILISQHLRFQRKPV